MRLTFNMQFNQSLNGILNAQQRMTKAESQLSKQTRILSPADDPAGAAKVLSLDQNKTQIDQYQTNSILLKNNLALQETVLTSMRTSYDRVLTLTIASGNGTYGAEQRKAIAFELRNIQTELFDLMNTRAADGSYIFAGYQDKTPAYERDPVTGVFEFKGDDGNRALQISQSISLPGNDSGKAIFESVFKRFQPQVTLAPAGANLNVSNQTTFDSFYRANFDSLNPLNNQFSLQIDAGGSYQLLRNSTAVNPPVTGSYTAGQPISFNGLTFNLDAATTLPTQVDFTLPPPEQTNVLNTIQRYIDILNDPNATSDELSVVLADTLQEIASTSSNVDGSLANLGGRLNVVDSVFNTNADLLISNQQYKADISEVDLAAALTEIKRQEVALQAASQTFQKVNATTLFDYIR
ncbi:flagellar hook-associated protein FlgL [Alishewanella agri BL06]|jgi:flagellar hook-associated protein 3 FlgL|uniref:Flagellar hook-associated protein FlgL n=1 Tax=Alishewanella agri BL06 TaxID=1195246 RepID=I9P5I4_9ALTE|nr:flagellar hook-associated protein FlgL [Alishewanella agri]EIW90252.1 flagellar hook-associated protein FlgL [Alishewanella agri BL06]